MEVLQKIMSAGVRFLAGVDLVLMGQSRKRCANTGQHWFGFSCLRGATYDNGLSLVLITSFSE